MAGAILRGTIPKPVQNPYSKSIKSTGQDYDYLMQRYKNIVNRGMDPNLSNLASQYKNLGRQQYTPTNLAYKRSSELGKAFENLGELSKTGGYSEEDIANLRARGISPIRAVYANAQQNINRQRALQGGYSPNYTAATAKLARDLSESVAGQTSNVNAGIAEQVARGRLSAAPQYTSAALAETGMIGDINARNAAEKARAFELNKAGQTGSLSALERLYGGQQDRELGALGGIRSLYGTTPATPALYGQQALQKAGLEEQKKARKQAGQSSLINAYRGMRFG
jgi:hypothetical protein